MLNIFTHSFRIYTSFFGEMKSNTVMGIYTYLFPMCLLRKTILFFPILQCYIMILSKDFVFVSWIPGGKIYFIRNKFSIVI